MNPITNPVAWFFHHNTVIQRHQVVNQAVEQPAGAVKEYFDRPWAPLPAPPSLEVALDGAIRDRLSCRRFQDVPLPLAELSAMLHAGYGIQDRVLQDRHETLTRPVPSGGALYPLEMYVLAQQVAGLDRGVYHYAVFDHGLELMAAPLPSPAILSELFLDQPYVASAAAVVVLTAVPARTLAKYGDRGYRLLLMEAGHVGQNLNLSATALGCGSVNLGGFLDAELTRLLALDSAVELPLYAVAVGKPGQGDRGSLRQP